MVNRQRLLRILILIEVFSNVALVMAAAIFQRTLPEPLRAYVESEELHPFLLTVAVILLVLLIAAWVGLWRGSSWAPAVYVVMWAGCVVFLPFGGPHVGTGIEEMFDFIGTSAGGGILLLVLLDMHARRSLGQTTLVDTPVSDEPSPAHLKSSRVHQVLSWLYGLFALMMLALPFVAGTGEEELQPTEMAKAFVFPLFFLVLFALHYLVSRGAKKRKRWARIGSIILACLLVPAVPLGTLVGVYLIRNRSWEAEPTK